MTEETNPTPDVETEETTEDVSLTAAVVQIAGFVAATAGAVFITRKVKNRLEQRKVKALENPVIETTSREV